jgi:hypothetical protein
MMRAFGAVTISKLGQSGASHGAASVPRAIVVFEDREESGRLRLLRRGFRHCFCLVGSGSAWTLCDPLLSRIALMQVNGLDETELLAELHALGMIALLGEVSPAGPAARVRLRPLSCVEIVKRILNLDLPWAITPYQLHRALLRLPAPHRPFGAYCPGALDLDIVQK